MQYKNQINLTYLRKSYFILKRRLQEVIKKMYNPIRS